MLSWSALKLRLPAQQKLSKRQNILQQNHFPLKSNIAQIFDVLKENNLTSLVFAGLDVHELHIQKVQNQIYLNHPSWKCVKNRKYPLNLPKIIQKCIHIFRFETHRGRPSAQHSFTWKPLTSSGDSLAGQFQPINQSMKKLIQNDKERRWQIDWRKELRLQHWFFGNSRKCDFLFCRQVKLFCFFLW